MWRKLIIGNMFRNKKRLFASVICMMLSFALIFTVVKVFLSFQNMRRLHCFQSYGKYNVLVYDVDPASAKGILNQLPAEVESGTEKNLGITRDGITLLDADSTAMEMNNYHLLKGTFPRNESEIALSATAIINEEYVYGNYDVGDLIKVDGVDYSLTGIIDDFDYSSDNHAFGLVRSTDTETGNNLYLFTEDNEIYKQVLSVITSVLDEDVIISDTEKYAGITYGATVIKNYDLNQVVLHGQGTLTDKNISVLLVVLIIIFVGTSLVLNTFVCSVYYRNRYEQQRILIRLGIPDYRIRICYYVEGLLLVTGSFAIGIGISIPFVQVVFSVIQSHRTVRLKDFNPVFSANAFLLSLGIAFITVFIGIGISVLRNSFSSKSEHENKRRFLFFNDNLPMKRKQLIFRFYRKENHYLSEKVMMLISAVLIGSMVFLSLSAGTYMRDLTNQQLTSEYQFIVVANRLEDLPDLPSLLDHVACYEMEYTVMIRSSVDRSLVDERYWDSVYFSGDSDIMPIEVDGVTQEIYNRFTVLSDTLSYGEFIKSKKAILKDGVYDEDREVNYLFPDSVRSISYEGRSDELVSFPSGEIEILAHSRNRTREDEIYEVQPNLVVPLEVFKERFEPSIILIYINADKGYEREMASRLGGLSQMYHFNLNDRLSGYMDARDNEWTVKSSVAWVLAIISILNMLILIYMNELRAIRMRRDLLILRRIGVPDRRVILPVIVELLVRTVVSAFLSVIISIVTVNKTVASVVSDQILEHKWIFSVYVFLLLLFVHVVSTLRLFLKLRKE